MSPHKAQGDMKCSMGSRLEAWEAENFPSLVPLHTFWGCISISEESLEEMHPLGSSGHVSVNRESLGGVTCFRRHVHKILGGMASEAWNPGLSLLKDTPPGSPQSVYVSEKSQVGTPEAGGAQSFPGIPRLCRIN